MSRFSLERWRLQIGPVPGHVSLYRRTWSGKWMLRAAENMAAIVGVPLADSIVQLQGFLAAQGVVQGEIDLLVPDVEARYFTVTPPSGLRGMAELRALARLRYGALFGADDSVIEADWHATLPFIACAMPRRLVVACDEFAQACGLRLVALRTHFVDRVDDVLARKAGSDAWVLVMADARAVCGVVESGRATDVFSGDVSVGPEGNSAVLHAHVSRLAVRHGHEMPSRVYVAGAPGREELLAGKTRFIFCGTDVKERTYDRGTMPRLVAGELPE